LKVKITGDPKKLSGGKRREGAKWGVYPWRRGKLRVIRGKLITGGRIEIG